MSQHSCPPPEGYLASLAGFDRMTTARLSSLLAHHDAVAAFHVAVGDAPPPPGIAALLAKDTTIAEAWRRSGRLRDPAECWQRCVDTGTAVIAHGDQRYPSALFHDPRAPAVLFVRGDLSMLDARRVGIVGTRNATQRGRETAAEFGFELSARGVTVVSGLAKGIDGAAHRGALAHPDARPLAVVGNGPDSPYPKQHASLWAEVSARGAVVSEWPPGTPPDAFRFPLRNRILAALVEVLVVIESRERGGSLITAKEAGERGVELFAVPGPVDSRASAGTNQLLCDGAAPATSVDDLMTALGLDQRRAGRARFDARPRPDGIGVDVLDHCRRGGRTIEQLMLLLDRPIAETAMVAARLERDGWLRETGGWFETIDQWGDLA